MRFSLKTLTLAVAICVFAPLPFSTSAHAQSFRERVAERLQERREQRVNEQNSHLMSTSRTLNGAPTVMEGLQSEELPSRSLLGNASRPVGQGIRSDMGSGLRQRLQEPRSSVGADSVVPINSHTAGGTGLMGQIGMMKEGSSLWNGPYPSGVKVVKNQSYGYVAREKLDAYLPTQASGASAVIIMVHGGGWSRGDKAALSVVENKVTRWVPKGVALISLAYPLIPETNPITQAREIGKALAWIEKHAHELHVDPQRMVLMGHSAGAHLISLLAAKPSLARSEGFKGSWRGVVSLDSGSMDIEQTMTMKHMPLFDQAFGTDKAFWHAASPMAQLSSNPGPMLLVCSSQRQEACAQNMAFKEKANGFGGAVTVLAENLSHGDINAQLGLDSPYTQAVERFLSSVGLFPND